MQQKLTQSLDCSDATYWNTAAHFPAKSAERLRKAPNDELTFRGTAALWTDWESWSSSHHHHDPLLAAVTTEPTPFLSYPGTWPTFSEHKLWVIYEPASKANSGRIHLTSHSHSFRSLSHKPASPPSLLSYRASCLLIPWSLLRSDQKRNSSASWSSSEPLPGSVRFGSVLQPQLNVSFEGKRSDPGQAKRRQGARRYAARKSLSCTKPHTALQAVRHS